ncbi:hypothetical protein H9Q72_000497 [Fusarium xylarioides]|uniref:Uncharacterized protein n=1 Tax=Fusarium xylarioides TaxID=221167 RepID=A0A9P7LBQ1_9HYPO|nr:hypothetical protein H9Q72_000497 [Fusarium xylarioides]KAG5811291.1 hypothetical protein H9Q71_004979 [Fusarium xylarioides]
MPLRPGPGAALTPPRQLSCRHRPHRHQHHRLDEPPNPTTTLLTHVQRIIHLLYHFTVIPSTQPPPIAELYLSWNSICSVAGILPEHLFFSSRISLPAYFLLGCALINFIVPDLDHLVRLP